METGRYFDYIPAALILYTIIVILHGFLSGSSKAKLKTMGSPKETASKIGMTDIYMVSFGDSITGYRSYKKRK